MRFRLQFFMYVYSIMYKSIYLLFLCYTLLSLSVGTPNVCFSTKNTDNQDDDKVTL